MSRARAVPKVLAGKCAEKMNAEIAKTRTIVFVEDNPVVLMAYRNRLEREGLHVEPALDGLEAMKVLAQFVPDLVVLDLMLPKISGVEVLKFICADPRYQTIPVIVLSTNSIIDTADDRVLERANRRLLKGSCTPTIILQAIQELLAGPSDQNKASAANQSDGSEPTESKAGKVLAGNRTKL